jgi:hypothetical protein
MQASIWVYPIILLFSAWPVQSAVNIDDKSCVNNDATIRAAFGEMVDMANWAYFRTVGLKNGTLTSSSDMRVTYNTFAALFGEESSQIMAETATGLISRRPFEKKVVYLCS